MALTDAEQLAQRIEKDLGDPARSWRLLASLAQDSTAAEARSSCPSEALLHLPRPLRCHPHRNPLRQFQRSRRSPQRISSPAFSEAAVVPDAIELPPLEIAEDFDFDAATKAFEEAEEKSGLWPRSSISTSTTSCWWMTG